MDLIDLHRKTKEQIRFLNLSHLKEITRYVTGGAHEDIFDPLNRSQYYQWLTALMVVLRPKQVVELGGAMGASALCMLAGLPTESKLYSITLPENGLEFNFIKDEYPSLVRVVGNDRDFELGVWPKDLKWRETQVLFIDSEHTPEQLRFELDTYIPLVGPDTLVVVDDIKLNDGLFQIWKSIAHPKLDVSDLHHSGFGIFYV